jgi:hypothetical protein
MNYVRDRRTSVLLLVIDSLMQAFDQISWAFASLIIVLRVIAIWDHNRLVSAVSFSVWSTAFALSIRSAFLLRLSHDSNLTSNPIF